MEGGGGAACDLSKMQWQTIYIDSNHSMCSSKYVTIYIQWNPSVTDTVGDQNFVCYSELSLTQGLPSGIFPVGVVCVIAQRGCIFRAFLCCTLAGNANRGMYYE